MVHRKERCLLKNKRNKPDANLQIVDSYKIWKKPEQQQILGALITYNNMFPSKYRWSRSLNSMVIEWDTHNYAYNWGLEGGRTQNVDLNLADEGKGYLEFLF